MRGDHLVVDRGLYRHHGVDLGDGSVVHFAGPGKDKTVVSVRLDTLQNFAGGAIVRIQVYGRCLDPDETVRRAESMVGSTGYDLVSNNCEHLASWCVTGNAESRQVERASAATGAAAVTLAANAGCADLLSAIGAVGGLSGPGVMSALATVGRLTGGGAVRGLYTLGLIPGLLGTAAVVYATRDKPCLTDEERRARTVARYAAGAGALTAGIGGIGVVSVAGATSGLSGAGIAAGLAAVGGVTGGGMVAGAGLLVAAPALAAALLAWLAYRIAMWWMRSSAAPPVAALI